MSDNNQNKKPSPPGLFNGSVFLITTIIFVLILSLFWNTGDKPLELKYSSILSYFDEGKVDEYQLDFTTRDLIIYLKEGEELNEEDKKILQAKEPDELAAGSSAPIAATTSESSNTSSENSASDGFNLLWWLGGAEAPAVDKRVMIYYQVPNITVFVDDVNEIVRLHNRENPDDKVDYTLLPYREPGLLQQILPQIIIMGVVLVPLFFMMRGMSGSAGGRTSNIFGKTKSIHRIEKSDVRFSDVAGADEEKEELIEVVEFLRNPSKYNSLGARIPRGVLLVGPPGTGKTLLAKAVAGEASVPFFSLAGSDFVEMFVGLGASRVRELFEEAKKSAPAIIFIDEIDAVGRQRGAGVSGGQDEREQTLNQLLVEMDGFGTNEGVIVISATNRVDILDKALLRAGRFDRQITVNYPDVKGRYEILKVHSKSKPLAPDVDLKVIAKTTVGFTGADLENLCNEAALVAAKTNKKAITMKDIEDSTMKVVLGLEKRSKVVSEKEKRSTCYHEAGHAVASYYLESIDRVHEVSIVPRGMAGGYTLSLPTEDRLYKFRGEMIDDMTVTHGGLISELLIYGDITTGASGDLKSIAKTAREMVKNYGFSDVLGTLSYDDENDANVLAGRKFSEKTTALIDDEVRKLVDEAYNKCKDILSTHIDKLHKIAKYLFAHEKISGEKFAELMADDAEYLGIAVLEDGSFKVLDDDVIVELDELEEKDKLAEDKELDN